MTGKKKNQVFAKNFKKHFDKWQKQQKGNSQERFAELVGLKSRVSVANYLTGENHPEPDVLAEICDVLQVTADELEGLNDHDGLYKYDKSFTMALHQDFESYCSKIGLSTDFLRFIKQEIADSDFPLYTPMISTITEPQYHRADPTEAFDSQSSNEFQRTFKGRTVNMSYADFEFLSEIQKEVLQFIQYLFFKRRQDMLRELQELQSASTHMVNGVPVYDSLPPEELERFDKYLQYVYRK